MKLDFTFLALLNQITLDSLCWKKSMTGAYSLLRILIS